MLNKLNRLIPRIAQENMPESQYGFRSNRGTADMTFMLRQIQETYRKQNIGLYAAFIDLTKAFDTVSCDGLENPGMPWLPPKFLIFFHEGQQGQVMHKGSLSGSFPIFNGI